MVKPIHPENVKTNPFAPEDIADLMDANIPEPIALVEGLIFEDTSTIIAGRPKGGKSFMSIPLAISLATGKDFLGKWKVQGKHRILICAEEDGRGRIRKRFHEMARMMKVDPDELRGRVMVISRKRLKLDNPDKYKDLISAISDFEPQIIILDTLSRLHGRDENSASDMQPVLDALEDLKDRFKACLIIIHHVNKVQAKGVNLFEKIRGSGAITANMDTIVLFAKSKSADGKLPIRTEVLVESKDGDPFNFTLVYDRPEEEVLLAVEDAPLSVDEKKVERVAGAFEIFLKVYKEKPKGVSSYDLMKPLKTTSKDTPKNRIKEMLAAGRIEEVKGTSNPKRYRPTEAKS